MAELGAIRYRQVGDALFLAETDGQAIFQLNTTGAALWRLLAEPATLDDAVALFQQAFPDRDRRGIEVELVEVMTALYTRGLIVADD